MARVRVCVELTDDELRAYAHEAEREGRTVESLIEQIVRVLWKEMVRAEEEGTDHPVIPC